MFEKEGDGQNKKKNETNESNNSNEESWIDYLVEESKRLPDKIRENEEKA